MDFMGKREENHIVKRNHSHKLSRVYSFTTRCESISIMKQAPVVIMQTCKVAFKAHQKGTNKSLKTKPKNWTRVFDSTCPSLELSNKAKERKTRQNASQRGGELIHCKSNHLPHFCKVIKNACESKIMLLQSLLCHEE